jgi:hypothetical protein
VSQLLLGLALTVGAPALKEKAPPAPPLIGRWADQRQAGLEYEFTPDGAWVIYQNGKVIDGTARTFKLVREDGPGAVDLWERDPVYPGMFKVEGDQLLLAFRHSGMGRPAAADTQGGGILTMTLVRVKKD